MSYEMVMTRAEMDSNEEKWLEMRKTGIGGSDAGVVMKLNPNKKLFELWGEKTGNREPVDLSDNEAVYWGHTHEDNIARRFTEVTGKKLKKYGMIRSIENPFMLADIDRVVVGENAILEIKTCDAKKAYEWEDDQIPASYYCQVLHYMTVYGADRAYIACLIGGNRMVWKTIEFNEEEAGILIDEEEKFWNEYVVPKKLPPVDESDACASVLRSVYPGGEDTILELDGNIETLLQDRERYKTEIAKLSETVTGIENKLRLAMENNDYGTSVSYKVTYKPRQHSSLDSKRLAKDYPSIYEQYLVSKPTRVLKITPLKRKED